jgi:hypothetical protein
MDTPKYAEVEAKDLKPGNELLCQYYDHTGAYREADVTVVAVRVFTRKVRLTYGGGWGADTVPATKVFGVKRSA